jgi:hypothetical protein
MPTPTNATNADSRLKIRARRTVEGDGDRGRDSSGRIDHEGGPDRHPVDQVVDPVADQVHHDDGVRFCTVLVESVPGPVGIGVRVAARCLPPVMMKPEVALEQKESEEPGEEEQGHLQARPQGFHGLGKQVQHRAANQESCGEADEEREPAAECLGVTRQGDDTDERKGAHQQDGDEGTEGGAHETGPQARSGYRRGTISQPLVPRRRDSVG